MSLPNVHTMRSGQAGRTPHSRSNLRCGGRSRVAASAAPQQQQQQSEYAPSTSQAVYTIAEAAPKATTSTRSCCAAQQPPTQSASASASLASSALSNPAVLAAAVGALGLGGLGLIGRALFSKGSRAYKDTSVGAEYDAWTEEGVLEHYWGEHIHLGYYTDAERAAGWAKKNFKQAKYDFVDEMLRFAGCAAPPTSILDVGCGFGGSSRYLAKKFPSATVRGITLSPKQVERGTQMAQEQGVTNTKFEVMDALAMTIPDNSIDLVWACESGEHMPDKKKYVEEMVRVLKPGGALVIACWCQRESTPERPFTQQDKDDLQFLYDEWAHPYFISYQEFMRLMQATGKMDAIRAEDWTPQTLPSWLHSIWVGVVDPWIVVGKPNLWYKCYRDGVTIMRMHNAFSNGLMQYGLIRGTKLANGQMAFEGVAERQLAGQKAQ